MERKPATGRARGAAKAARKTRLSVYLEAFSDHVLARWAVYGERGMAADCVREIRPGQLFYGVPYERLREVAERNGEIQVEDSDDEEEER